MKQLITFRTLAKTLNYQKAAEQLQYAPSTLFKHIQLLEQELGVNLFFKQGRQLCLTAEGNTFVEHADKILESYYNAVDSISATQVQESAMMLGGCEVNTGNSLLRLLNQFAQLYPRSRVSLLTSPNTSVPQLVKNDLVDLGFYYCVDGKPQPGLESARLYREPAYLLTTRSNPILQKGRLAYEDLRGMPFISPHDTCCFVAELMALLKRRDVKLGNVTYLGNMNLVVDQVRAEQALTLMPHSAVANFCATHDMAVLDLGQPRLWGWEMLLYKSYESLRPLAKALLRHATDYAQERLREDPMLSNEWAEDLTVSKKIL